MQNTLQECARNIAGGEKFKSYSAYDSRVASVVKDPRLGERRGEDRHRRVAPDSDAGTARTAEARADDFGLHLTTIVSL